MATSDNSGKVAIITGASQGIGKAIALRLAKDGFDIGLNDIPAKLDALQTLAREIEALGRKTHLCPCDVSEEKEVKEMISSVVSTLNGLDVMVANAGINIGNPETGIASLTESSVESWDKIMAVNARGVFLCYKYAAQQMIAQGSARGGRIIGASSVYGKRGNKFATAYSASKFAVRGLTQSAAEELGPHKITVNAYAPGYVDTELTMKSGMPSLKEGEYLELGAKESVLGYNAVPDDMAGLVSYIASKEAHFVTGQTISINGGLFFD
jgi:NAD(P)-dependent dehydrogenase (short-subunit alcohol dehydrogenase family)